MRLLSLAAGFGLVCMVSGGSALASETIPVHNNPTKPAASKATLKAKHTGAARNSKPAVNATATYANPSGWQVSFLKNWKYDKVDIGDPANNALVFFQSEEDAVERLAVSMLPVSDTSAASLLQKVKSDVYMRYDSAEVQPETKVSRGDQSALVTSFVGLDTTHPGVKTHTLLMVMVRNGKGYVISARTSEDHFAERRALLEKLVKSFAFTTRTASRK